MTIVKDTEASSTLKILNKRLKTSMAYYVGFFI